MVGPVAAAKHQFRNSVGRRGILRSKNAFQGSLRNRRRDMWETECPSAKAAESDEFRCSDVAFRQAMSLRLEPHPKFIIGAEDSEDLRLRFVRCVGKRRTIIHSLQRLVEP